MRGSRGQHGIPSGALIAVACGLLIGACGSSGKPLMDANGGPLLRLAQCMRGHGVPAFPDPSSAGGLVIPNGIDTGAPAFMSAQRACARYMGPGERNGRRSESRKLQFLALAGCMRAHGVPNFPDPTSSPPPPSAGNAIGGDGWYLALGTAQERLSPTYKRAAATCAANIR